MFGIRSLVGLFAMFLLLLTVTTTAGERPPGRTDFDAQRTKAEALYDQGAYAAAKAIYDNLDIDALTEEQKRWTWFRRADCTWRSLAGTRQPDDTALNRARQGLAALTTTTDDDIVRDDIRALAHESLGASYIAMQHRYQWPQAWSHFSQALEYWAASSDIDRARERYLDIVWQATESGHGWRHEQWVRQIPARVLENAQRIAQRDGDRARATYLLARHLSEHATTWSQRRQVESYFTEAASYGEANPWYDDTLYHHAKWVSRFGIIERDDEGQWTTRPDFVRAVNMLEGLLATFDAEWTMYEDEARDMIEEITTPDLQVSVPGTFKPSSEVRIDFRFRNIAEITCELYAFDVIDDLEIGNDVINDWTTQVDARPENRVRTWSIDVPDAGDHRPGARGHGLDEPLPRGAYLLVARGGGETRRELVLVSDLAVVTKQVFGTSLIYIADALTGEPVADADVIVWRQSRVDRRWISEQRRATTANDGTCMVRWPETGGQHRQSLLVVRLGDRHYIMSANAHHNREPRTDWRFFMASDRPAYRPGETVQWTATARRRVEGSYTTPSDSTIEYDITNQLGDTLDEGTLTLDEFGTASGSIELDATEPLGEYIVGFSTPNGGWIGGGTLFRIEEYKLPEFNVTVSTPKNEDGSRASYLLGERVSATIDAEYYFGAPVANASVEYTVMQRAFWWHWTPQREYDWYYEADRSRNWWNPGTVIARETTRTDAAGQATIAFDTPEQQGTALEFIIEARVTDAARREVTGSTSLRITTQRHGIFTNVERHVVPPGDPVEVEFVARDASDQPVVVSGTVSVSRLTWREVWFTPAGEPLTGAALDARKRQGVFPPPDEPGWTCRRREFVEEPVLREDLEMDSSGTTTLAFRSERTGYYKVSWSSDVTDEPPVTAETYFWIARPGDVDIRTQSDGVQIVLEKDTYRAGEDAIVMITTPVSGRHVLVTLEGRDIYHTEVIDVPRTAKLVRIPLDDRSIPNVGITATMVDRYATTSAMEQIVVPPVDQFLTVDVEMPSDAYEPRDETRARLRVTDVNGDPVSASLSFGLVDASVFAIQPPYATDPRPVFYGERQPMFVRTAMSTQQRGFVELVRSEDGQLLTPAEAARLLDLGSLEQLLTRENDELGASRQAGVGGGSTFGDPESAVADSMSMRSMSVAPQSPPVNRKTQAGHTVAEGPVNEWVDPDSIVVRSDFRSTVFWSPQIRTDDDGVATVDIAFADSLTEWRGTAFAVTRGTKVGVGEVTVRTRQPVIARLQAPRFFTVGDSVTISGVFNNNTDKDLRIRPMLEVDGLVLTTDADATELVTPANGEARLDWVVFADTEGEARLRLIAQGREHADAMERTYPVKAHGIEKFIASSGKVRGDRLTVRMELPPAKQDAMTLRVQVSGSMAVTMLDALPYLVDYPYGCTEQTMSRFVPTVATLKTLNDLGIEPGEAIRRVYGGIDPRYVDETHDRVSQTREAMRNLDDVTTQSLARLYDFQKSDGGWGWWKGGSSDLFMSAYVVWGLSTALEAAVDVDRERLRRGAMYLAKELVEAEDQRDLQVWMLHAIAAYRQATGDRELSAMEGRAFAELFVRKDQLNAYGRSLLALTAHAYGRNNDAVVLVRTLENGVIRDDRPDASVIIGTPGDRNAGVISRAHWGADGIAYHWSDGAVESTAWALRAMMAIDPDHVLVEPVTNWLVANRRGAHWSNTRDTAMTVLALNDYLRASGELEGDLSFDVMVNGRMVASQTIDADARLDGPRWIDVDPSLLHEGENNMTIIRRGGEGAIYYSAQATFFTLEEPIRAAGNELFVDRSYYKLVPRETLLKGVVYDRVPLLDGGYVRSGERVEVILTVDAKTDLEYLVFEDQKPAGFEPVQVRSGEAAWFRQLTMLAIERAADQNDPDRLPATRPSSHYTGRSCWVHQELRDDRTVIFADKLPEGVWEIRYDYRAEVPGAFHGLPLVAHAMYVPEIRANSDELRVEISDRDD